MDTQALINALGAAAEGIENINKFLVVAEDGLDKVIGLLYDMESVGNPGPVGNEPVDNKSRKELITYLTEEESDYIGSWYDLAIMTDAELLNLYTNMKEGSRDTFQRTNINICAENRSKN